MKCVSNHIPSIFSVNGTRSVPTTYILKKKKNYAHLTPLFHVILG